jgi:RimJ/RimL family protein N-acetyltransferase
MERLRQHDITLRGERLTLRPITEGDWGIVQRWESDPDVLYYFDSGWVNERELQDTQMIYRGVSQAGFVFVAELEGRPIGVCWLQKMNLDRLLAQFPGKDVRRIDLAIGEKELWGHGLGTEMIRTLTRFGFESEKCDAIFGCGVGDYNPRSRRAFERNGYTVFAETPQPEGSKAKVEYDLMLAREAYFRM